MVDEVDRANESAERDLAIALTVRKQVPTICECGEPCAVLPNGARARFCYECLAVWQGAQHG